MAALSAPVALVSHSSGAGHLTSALSRAGVRMHFRLSPTRRGPDSVCAGADGIKVCLLTVRQLEHIMRAALLWGLLALLCQLAPVQGHVLGRPSTPSDLEQLKSLLQQFEATLSEAAPEEDSEADYEPNPENQHSAGSRSWGPAQDDPAEGPAQGYGRTPSQRSRLQDLLLTARRSSGCFGARMDRIGNASGLGCGRG